MKRKRAWVYWWLGALVITGALLTPGCNDAGENGSVSELSFDSLSYDFGMVEAEAGTETRTLTITNDGGTSVTVSGVELSDTTNYSLETEDLPLTLEIGDSTTVICTFNPQASGAFTSTVTVSAEELVEDAEIALYGEGNFAPTIGSGYFVFDPPEEHTGFYVEAGEKNGKTMYKKSHGTVMYLYFFDSSSSNVLQSRGAPVIPDPTWVLADSLDITDVANEALDFTTDSPAPEAPENGNWSNDLNVGAEDSMVVAPSVTATPEFEVYYGYTDAEGDAESGTTFQWYDWDTETDEGTIIPDATGKTYPLVIGETIKCAVTPGAESGIRIGSTVYSDVIGQIIIAEQ